MRTNAPSNPPVALDRGDVSDAEVAAIAAGKEGGFARKVVRAVYTSSGFYPGSNQPWRTSADPHPIPPSPVIPSP